MGTAGRPAATGGNQRRPGLSCSSGKGAPHGAGGGGGRAVVELYRSIRVLETKS